MEEGIIRFEITVPTVNDGALERKLEERFGLRRAFVVESGPDEEGGDIDALGRAGPSGLAGPGPIWTSMLKIPFFSRNPIFQKNGVFSYLGVNFRQIVTLMTQRPKS